MKRISEQQAFMEYAVIAAKRSTCIRRQIGAVVVQGGKVISTGYNGAPRNHPHCTELGCLRDELGIETGTRHEVCRGVHAEQNALLHAGFNNSLGSTLYTTTFPCSICAKMIVNAGISQICYLEGYPDDSAEDYITWAHIQTFKMKL